MQNVVYIVDDDPDVRALLAALISTIRVPTRAFASGMEFLHHVDRSWHGCVLLDVRMPQIGGLEVAEQLRRRDLHLPIVLMSGFADVPMAIRAIKAGAIDFVQKPFDSEDLLERVRQALDWNHACPAADFPCQVADPQLKDLTRRERQVLDLILAGKLNKQIAAELGIGIRTVETHRAQLMRKTACRSLAELIRTASPLARQTAHYD